MTGFIINRHDHNSSRQSLGRLVVSAKGPGMGIRDILRGLAAARTPSGTGCLGQQPGMGHKRQGLPDQSRGHFQTTQTCPLPSSGSPLSSGGNHTECLMASKVLWETASLLNLTCAVTVSYPRYTHMPLHRLFPLLGHYTHAHTHTRIHAQIQSNEANSKESLKSKSGYLLLSTNLSCVCCQLGPSGWSCTAAIRGVVTLHRCCGLPANSR